jgi:hypothetical protein
MSRSRAAALALVLVCAAIGPAGATCSDQALHATDHVYVYLQRGDTLRAMRVYEGAAGAALACATRQRTLSAHDALVRAAADDFRSAADIARSAKVGDKSLALRWYAESSRLYRGLIAAGRLDAATRGEVAAEATSNDDFAAQLSRSTSEKALVRDAHGAQTVAVWSTLRRFCHQLSSLRAGRASDVADSSAVSFVASGTAVTLEAPRSVVCPGGQTLALTRVRMTAGAMTGHEGWILDEDLTSQ